MASKNAPYRCPKCKASSLHQQLNKTVFSCASCGARYRLIPWKFS